MCALPDTVGIVGPGRLEISIPITSPAPARKETTEKMYTLEIMIILTPLQDQSGWLHPLMKFKKPITVQTAHRKDIKQNAVVRESGEKKMGKIVHQSHITITRENGPTRKAVIKGFNEPVYYGVHGGIKDFFGVSRKRSMPPHSIT